MTKFAENQKQFLNEAKFYFVCKPHTVSDQVNNEKYLCETMNAPNGWKVIPANVSRSLEGSFNGDFIKDYMKKYYKIFHSHLNCFKGIEFVLNSKIIPNSFTEKNMIKNTNNNDLRIFYFFENPDNADDKDFNGDFYLWRSNPNSKDITDDFYSLTNDLENLELDMEESANESLNISELDTPSKKISFENINITERDYEMEEYALKFKYVYENHFMNYLKSLKKNDSLSVTSMPTNKYCKESFEDDMMNSITLNFHFDSIEHDDNGKISAVIANSHDRLHTHYFEPFICNSYGPYFSTTLLTSMYNVGRKNSAEQMFFLDLPIYLYNKLEADD